MRKTVQRIGVNSKRRQSVVGWEKKPRMCKLEKRGGRGVGGMGGKDSIAVFISEALSRGGRIDLLCLAPQGRIRANGWG